MFPSSRAMNLRSHQKAAFTLIELLAVISITGILAAMLIPAVGKAKSSADSLKCTSNLRQIGVGILSYVSDNDGKLPGPAWAGQSPWYNRNDKASMPYILEEYLNLEPGKDWGQRADVFVCPSYEKAVRIKDAPVYFFGSSNNLTRLDAGGAQLATVYYFGYPSGATQQEPMRMGQLASLANKNDGSPIALSKTVAVRDLDQKDTMFSGSSWYGKLPKSPVHGNHRNALFLDWHVGKVDIATNLPK